MEEQWRCAYIEECKARRLDGESVAADPRDIREAIARAQRMFPGRLLVKLNSRSNENTPFENPAEVLDALAWLATAYRTRPDESIADTCPGWFFKPNSSAVTMGRFPDWYRTRINGTAWELSAHLGRGASRDPRRTIRIAFAWDGRNERVIVGFVGLHQRSRRS